uniref:C2H2-type domain-containing protein n=1 Tax=Aegilops tauschii TaxID=37682 RepID=R7WDR0_AEGTA
MEFHFPAGEERCPSMGAVATSAKSETAATRVHDGLVGCDGTGYHGESLPPPASDPDGLRRRAAKERIRERILREEAEAMALEFEVRLCAGWIQSRRVCGRASQQAENPSCRCCIRCFGGHRQKKQKPDLTCTVCNITATSEVALQEHLRGKSHVWKAGKPAQPHPEEDVFSLKVNGSPALPAMGENPGVVVASMALAEKSCNNLGLNCMVCGIIASTQNNMQDHLKGKIHMRKTAMLAQPYPKENGVCSKPNASAAVLPAKRKNSNVVPASSTLSAGPSSKNQKQDLTCTATSEKGMQDHLKGKAHMNMAASLAPGEAEEEAEVEGGYKPWKFEMLTDSGTLCEVVKLNGSVICEGSKHISKQAKQKQCEAVEPPAAVAADGDGPGSEMEANGVGRVDGGSLLCELCNVKVPSECAMQSHLSGRKHTNKAKVVAVAVGACGNGSGSKTVPMEANGVRRLDGGILLCELCDMKASSECVMRTHLSGRKHTNKQKATADTRAGQEVKKAAAAATVGSSSKEAASIVVNGSDDSVKKPAAGEMEVVVSSATPQVDVAAPVCVHVSSVVPMEVDEGAEAGDGAAKAEEQEKADAEEEGAVEIDAGPAVTGEEYYIKAEGKLFVTLRQADDSLSCGLCAVHVCDKRGMINHIYTRDHWRRARLAEEKRASEAAPEAVNKDGDGVPVTDGEAHVDN